jgi:hypothetical protein
MFMAYDELLENLRHFVEVTEEVEHDDVERLARYIDNNYTVHDYAQLVDDVAQYVRDEEEAYLGFYESEADFAERYFEDTEQDIPSWVVVDWQATFDYSLRYDVVFESGWVWRNI